MRPPQPGLSRSLRRAAPDIAWEIARVYRLWDWNMEALNSGHSEALLRPLIIELERELLSLCRELSFELHDFGDPRPLVITHFLYFCDSWTQTEGVGDFWEVVD